MKFFLVKKFNLGIKEISTLKSNIYNLFLIKLSADISHSSFLLDSLSKAKIFPNFSAGNSFLFINRFWNVIVSDKRHFIVKVFFLKKEPIELFSIFLFYHIKIIVFDKS